MNDSRKKMLDKVRAIMSKTMDNGCAEGEAMAALVKARQLMAAHDIAESELGNTVEHESATIHRSDLGDFYQVRQYLSVGVARFTRCKVWKGHSYGVAFCGLESDVLFATWLIDTLQRFVLRELKNHQAQRRAQGLKSPRIVCASFVLGCVRRINERLRELTPVEPVGHGLVVSRQALITAAMAAAGIGPLREIRGRRRTVNGAALAAGSAAGNGARFDRPVGSGGNLMLNKS